MASGNTTRSKIQISLWTVLHDALNRLVEQSCFRRDALLERIVSSELPHLEKEISIPNSLAAQRIIANHLVLLPRTAWTLQLSPETIRKLTAVCEAKRIPRDAFFNRLVLCLVATPKILQIVFGLDDYRREVDRQWESPAEEHSWQCLRMMPDLVQDPFWFIRAALEIGSGESDVTTTFYGAYIPEGLFGNPRKSPLPGKKRAPNVLGLNVYLPDSMIPGHPAEKAALEALGL
jgi:hypothetical protein